MSLQECPCIDTRRSPLSYFLSFVFSLAYVARSMLVTALQHVHVGRRMRTLSSIHRLYLSPPVVSQSVRALRKEQDTAERHWQCRKRSHFLPTLLWNTDSAELTYASTHTFALTIWSVLCMGGAESNGTILVPVSYGCSCR